MLSLVCADLSLMTFAVVVIHLYENYFSLFIFIWVIIIIII